MKKKKNQTLEALKSSKQVKALDKNQQLELKGGLGYGEWW